MTQAEITALRNRVRHYMSPEVAQSAGLTVPDLEQFIASHFFPTEAQLTALAIRLRL